MLLDGLPFGPNWSRMPPRQFAPPTSRLPECPVNTSRRTSKRPTIIVHPEMAVQGTPLPNLGFTFSDEEDNNDGHESFVLSRHPSSGLDFRETARKSYHLVVATILTRAKMLAE
jgi:hypothetical protein